MLPYLPVELLRLIVQSLQLPDFSSYRRTVELENGTRSTLRFLCLTSRTLRQLAQPLLFHFLRLQDDRQLRQVIDQADSKNLLDHARILGLNENLDFDALVDSGTLSNFHQIEQLLIFDQICCLRSFASSSLKRLFLSHVTFDFPSTSTSLPCLEVLGLYHVVLASGLSVAKSFPHLRHLHFDFDSREGLEVDQADVAFLTHVAPRLYSLSLNMDNYPGVTSEAPSLQIQTILVSLPWDWWESFSAERSQAIVHLRLVLTDMGARTEEPEPRLSPKEVVSKFPSSFETDFPRLESIYLPPLDSLPPRYRDDDIVKSLQKLTLVCQRRGIEVIHEEQSDRRGAETQISEEFMGRMTRRKIAEEEKASGEKKS